MREGGGGRGGGGKGTTPYVKLDFEISFSPLAIRFKCLKSTSAHFQI